MVMATVKKRKHSHSITSKAIGKSKDPLLQIIGLAGAKPSDITKDHNKVLYEGLKEETIKRIDGARERVRKSHVSHEKVTREFLRWRSR